MYDLHLQSARAFIFLDIDLFWWVDVYREPDAHFLNVRLAYAPQLGARLHISHTQINIVGLAANGG